MKKVSHRPEAVSSACSLVSPMAPARRRHVANYAAMTTASYCLALTGELPYWAVCQPARQHSAHCVDLGRHSTCPSVVGGGGGGTSSLLVQRLRGTYTC